MPRRGQQPALVHGTVDWCLPGRRYSGVGYGSAGGLAASGQRVGCHQELGTERENVSFNKLLVCFIWLGNKTKSNVNPEHVNKELQNFFFLNVIETSSE